MAFHATIGIGRPHQHNGCTAWAWQLVGCAPQHTLHGAWERLSQPHWNAVCWQWAWAMQPGPPQQGKTLATPVPWGMAGMQGHWWHGLAPKSPQWMRVAA